MTECSGEAKKRVDGSRNHQGVEQDLTPHEGHGYCHGGRWRKEQSFGKGCGIDECVQGVGNGVDTWLGKEEGMEEVMLRREPRGEEEQRQVSMEKQQRREAGFENGLREENVDLR